VARKKTNTKSAKKGKGAEQRGRTFQGERVTETASLDRPTRGLKKKGPNLSILENSFLQDNEEKAKRKGNS